jgi:hypothetical protein
VLSRHLSPYTEALLRGVSATHGYACGGSFIDERGRPLWSVTAEEKKEKQYRVPQCQWSAYQQPQATPAFDCNGGEEYRQP